MKDFLLALVAGSLTALSFPRYNVPLAFIAGFLLFFYLTEKVESLKKAFVISFFTALPISLLDFYWVLFALKNYGDMSLSLAVFVFSAFAIVLTLFLALPFLASFFLVRKLQTKGFVLIPFIFVIFDILREFFPFSGFPWNLYGYILSYIGSADLLTMFGGIYLLTFLALLIPTFIYISLKKRSAFFGVVSFILVATLFIPFDRSYKCKEPVRIAVLQGNIDESIKAKQSTVEDFQEYVLNVYINLFKQAARKKPDLIILPESALPFNYFSESVDKDKFFKDIKPFKIAFAVGLDSIIYKNTNIKIYNSFLFFDKNHQLVGVYNKNKLVPFGEYVPHPFKVFESLFPYLGGYDFSRGKDGKIITIGRLKIAPLICYESIFPLYVANLIKKGANLIANITNDGWFGKTVEPYQHLEMSRVRAVENKRYFIRATNSGISAVINSYGKIEATLGLNKRGVLIANVCPIEEKTFWTIYSNYLIGLWFVLFTFLFILFYLKK